MQLLILGARDVNEIRNRVALLSRSFEFSRLNEDGRSGEKAVRATVIEVKVGVNDDADICDRHAQAGESIRQ
jgi:hypothetical protein